MERHIRATDVRPRRASTGHGRGGASGTRAHRENYPSSWSGALTLGRGHAVFVGRSGDNSPHAHAAIQICVASRGTLAVRFDGRRRFTAPGIVVPAGVRHQLERGDGYVPFQLVVVNGLALAVIAGGAGAIVLALLFALAVATSFLAESLLPYSVQWNVSKGDVSRDIIHATVNETLNIASLGMIPALAAFDCGFEAWPHRWPFVAQTLAAIAVLDLGVTLAHYASHRLPWLWRFHAVHHSVERMYGFNGLMKHPVHQSIEMAAGTLPLVLVGMAVEIGAALAFMTAIQLLVQHSNVDFRLGPLRTWLATAEIHRLHHRADPALGDVNFGLFTTIGDRLLRTLRDRPAGLQLSSSELGIDGEPDYPSTYFSQLIRPFRG